MDSIGLMTCIGALGAIEPVLSNFLSDEFGTSQTVVIFSFMVPIISYPITVVLINTLLKNMQHKSKIFIGLLTIGFALLFTGPFPLTGLSPNFYLTIFSLFIVGAGMAFTMIPALPDMVDNATEELSQFEPSLISDRVSAIVTLSVYVGKGVAGQMSGLLKNYLSFQYTISTFALLTLFIAISYGIYGGGLAAVMKKKSYKSTAENLLGEKEMVESKKSFYLLEEDEV